MKQKLMISYSRQQIPFVDRFYADLEKAGHPIWLDYRSLVPARPWFQQIEAGVSGADAMLLIVSKDSIRSKNVEPEWRLALQLKKRIILVIFETVALPPELQACEWVDFRVNHKKSLKELENLLGSEPKKLPCPPQRGFKAPKRFWLALVLSVLVLIGSISTLWTVFVPLVLFPLPWQIYQRNYHFARVIPVLLLLPVFFFFSLILTVDEGNIFSFINIFMDQNTQISWLSVASLAGWALLGLLMTATMQRRARPQAARVRFANPLIPLVPDVKELRSVAFAIDHAPEDGRYAEDLRRGLERYGHRQVGPNEKPEAAFVLISTYQKSTSYNPDEVAVFPVLLQGVTGIDKNLQRIQWLDFRHGMRNLKKLALLLPEPEQLLKTLAVTPSGAQEIFPLEVNALLYFYIITGILGLGSLLTDGLTVGKMIFLGQISADMGLIFFRGVIFIVLLLGAVFYPVQALRLRRGGMAAIYPLLILTFFQGLIYFFSDGLGTTVSNEVEQELVGAAAESSFLTLLAFPLGILITLPFLLFGWQNLYRWLPRRQAEQVGRLESLLLLYTPLRRRALIFHILFHMALISAIVLLFLLDFSLRDGWGCIYIFFLLLALGLRWLARKISK